MQTRVDVDSGSLWDLRPWPAWWHHRGEKMTVTFLDTVNTVLELTASAASVTIKELEVEPVWQKPLLRKKAASAQTPIVYKTEWIVRWQVVQTVNLDFVNGQARFFTEELRAAFGIQPLPRELSHMWLIQQYGADDARQKLFIRRGPYLNIPCPGTGHDGDPNVSIYVTDEIKAAVEQLLKCLTRY